MPKVTFRPSNTSHEVANGVTLLKAAQAAGVDITWCCGGNATCTTCRCRVEEGGASLSPADQVEREILEAVNLAEPWRLACQTKVLGDVRIEIPVIPT